jgi:hypothetical protein
MVSMETAIQDLARDLGPEPTPSPPAAADLEVEIEVVSAEGPDDGVVEPLDDPWFQQSEEMIAAIPDDPTAKIYEIRPFPYDILLAS